MEVQTFRSPSVSSNWQLMQDIRLQSRIWARCIETDLEWTRILARRQFFSGRPPIMAARTRVTPGYLLLVDTGD